LFLPHATCPQPAVLHLPHSPVSIDSWPQSKHLPHSPVSIDSWPSPNIAPVRTFATLTSERRQLAPVRRGLRGRLYLCIPTEILQPPLNHSLHSCTRVPKPRQARLFLLAWAGRAHRGQLQGCIQLLGHDAHAAGKACQQHTQMGQELCLDWITVIRAGCGGALELL
jgi:hypothetical protein